MPHIIIFEAQGFRYSSSTTEGMAEVSMGKQVLFLPMNAPQPLVEQPRPATTEPRQRDPKPKLDWTL